MQLACEPSGDKGHQWQKAVHFFEDMRQHRVEAT